MPSCPYGSASMLPLQGWRGGSPARFHGKSMQIHAHPLDPLNAAEIERAVALVRAAAGLDPSAWFETITLEEPNKAYVRGFRPGDLPQRRAFVCCYEPTTNRTFEGVVDL